MGKAKRENQRMSMRIESKERENLRISMRIDLEVLRENERQ